MARVLLNVPKSVQRGEPVPVRVLISHPMESGQRRDEAGRPILTSAEIEDAVAYLSMLQAP